MRPSRFRVLARHLGLLAAALMAPAATAISQQYDLSGLPAYHDNTYPQELHGVIRIHDTELPNHLCHQCVHSFLKLHPIMRFAADILPSGFTGLCACAADLYMMLQ